MYELTVEKVFTAAHAIIMNGERETLHSHDWRTRVTVGGLRLDTDGLLCDFHLLEREVERLIGRFHQRTLNDTAPFDRVNPTAELVAKHIADSLAGVLPAGVTLRRVSVTEATGCEAAITV